VLLAGLLVGVGLVAANLLPGAGTLVARAWSLAAPGGARSGASRLSRAEVQALTAAAEAAWQRGNWEDVVASVTALAEAGLASRAYDARLYEAHVSLGWALLAEDRREEAEAHLVRALEVRPDGQEALEGLRMARQPGAAASQSLAQPVAQAAASSVAVSHVVQRGDTLFALARRFGTSVEAIMAANSLTGSTIRVGQTLVIPACPTACAQMAQVTMCTPTCVPVCPSPPPPTCVPVCPPVVCVPVCPTPVPTCVPVCPPVVCVPVCPPVVCVPVCPPVVCVPVCPPVVCVPVDP